MARLMLWTIGAIFGCWIVGSRLATSLPGLAHGARDGSAVAASAAAPVGPGERLLVLNADFLGHFRLHPVLDGTRISMVVDTGASMVALTSEDAAAAGYRPKPGDYKHQVSTANGVVAVAPIRIRELRVGDIVVHDVEGVVVPPGRLGQSLLGMSFLRALSGFEMAHGRLTLRG